MKYQSVKKIALFVSMMCLLLTASAQSPRAAHDYWQQQVNYLIDVTLNDKENTLDAYEKIEYINHSPDTLHFIWFHLWPNAYKNDKTAFSDQLLENGNTKFYFSGKDDRGYINRLDFKVNNIIAKVEDHPQHIDIVKLILPDPLAPGEKVSITTPFHVKLPYNFSRGGHVGKSYQVTQWYPKPAVYDSKGWHPMPYIDQGEFYSEFGNFDVRISLPKNYVVAATGELQDKEEKEWMEHHQLPDIHSQPEKKFQSKSPATVKPKKTDSKEKDKKLSQNAANNPQLNNSFPEDGQTKTLRYTQNNIHDFAWFAHKQFIVNHDTLQLETGKIIDVYTYYTPKQKQYWQNSVSYCKEAIKFYSQKVGPYPYNVVSAVQGPESFGGGMEYPTITVISPVDSKKDLDYTIAHEVGHNWFYGILASNEREHPWMDEGINSFFDNKYYSSRYGRQSSPERIIFETTAVEKTDQPIETSSENFNSINYEMAGYYKAAEWMRLLESEVGPDALDKAVHDYYRQWQFKHPGPEDFNKSIEESTGKNLQQVFALRSRTGILPNQERSGSAIAVFPSTKFFSTLKNGRAKNLFSFAPVAGYNTYDKIMPGLVFTNMKLPPSKFQFLLLPMYATGSKKPVGLAKLSYLFYPGNFLRKAEVFVNGSTFSNDEFTDIAGEKTDASFKKIVPGFKLTARQKAPRSTVNKYIQWKTYFIGEENLNFSNDTVINGIDTSIALVINKETQNRVLNQLKIVVENYRALYPYSGELKIEQGKDFVRTAFTGKYFFNYPKLGGMAIRFFAGKFFYTTSKTYTKQFNTDRYHLNMTGPNGYEDYTYSDYFIGRNKFDQLPSQQIMVRDGGFKIRTDLLADKIGKSENWLVAANFTSTIPSSINPLSVLPVKIPLKIFVDAGTYAEAWENDAESERFLFDAGLQLSFLKETVNIYLPLVYSKVYKDYIQSTLQKRNRLLKTISFSIDISNFTSRKVIREIIF